MVRGSRGSQPDVWFGLFSTMLCQCRLPPLCWSITLVGAISNRGGVNGWLWVGGGRLGRGRVYRIAGAYIVGVGVCIVNVGGRGYAFPSLFLCKERVQSLSRLLLHC